MNRSARNAWGGALVVGAAAAMVPSLLPNLPSVLDFLPLPARWAHEAPLLTLAPPARIDAPLPPLPPADPGVPEAMDLVVRATLTEPGDARAAVEIDGVALVATGGGLLRLDPADPAAARVWTTADGLPDHRLTAIARLAEGVVVGTEGGAILWLDGLDAARPTVRAVASVSAERITALLVADGLVWVGTAGDGVLVGVPADPAGFRPVGPSTRGDARRITSLARAGGQLVAGTAGGGLFVRDDDGRTRRYVRAGGLVDDLVLDVLAVDGGVLSVGPGGASLLRRGVLVTARGGDGLPTGVLRAAGRDASGGVLVGVAGGRIGRRGSAETWSLPEPPAGRGPWHGVALPEVRFAIPVGRRVLVGTTRGLLLGDARGRGLVAVPLAGPGANDLTSVAARDGRVLVGSFDAGASLAEPGGAFVPLPSPSGEVNDVALDADGAAWLATSRGLARVDGGRLRTWGEAQGLAHEHVAAIDLGPGGLLVGTTAGVQRFDGVGLVAMPSGRDAVANVFSVAWRGEDVLVGTLTGLWELGAQARRYRFETGELPDSWVAAVAAGVDGTVWAGTYDRGLATRDAAGGWRRLGEADGLPCGWVNPDAILPLSDGSALVGTLGGGLLRVRRDRVLDVLTPADGLAGLDVTGLARDGDTVWVATRSGLSRLEIVHAPPRS